MKRLLSRFIFTVFYSSALVISFSTIPSHSLSCFPTCSSVDGRFLAITQGIAFQTLTSNVLNVRIIVPGGTNTFSLGIFDGDQNGNTNGVMNWDTGSTLNEPYTYVLMADPDRDDNGPQVFMTHSDDLLNNEWVDFVIANDPMALDEDGTYVYTLAITLLTDVQSLNAFKLRSDVGLLEINEIFTFVAQMTSFEDFLIIFPNADFTDGTIDPEDLVDPTYDGSFSFFFNFTEDATELEFWDGDADHGNYNGSDIDTDDPNTPNEIPAFSPPGTFAIPEGVNPPDPPDDLDPTGGTLGTNLLYVRPPAVVYSLITPLGEVFENTNPSGNREWEKFVVSTTQSDPAIVDFMAQELPQGTYEIRFEGLDMANLVAINPLFPFVLTGEVIPNRNMSVPTMSEWGLFAVAVVMGIIGIIVVRRKHQTS